MNELLDGLWQASLWLALGALLLAAARPLLVKLGGAELAYRSWWLLPLLLVLTLSSFRPSTLICVYLPKQKKRITKWSRPELKVRSMKWSKVLSLVMKIFVSYRRSVAAAV